MARKLYIETQGCQMNEYDSSRMLDLLSDSHQLVRTDIAEEADVLLLNTCSIREKAQEKVFSQLGRWQRLKLERPNVIIGVGGCVASQEGEGILQRAPYVDMVFGPQTLHRLPQMLTDLSVQPEDRERIAQVDVSFPENEKFDFLPEPKIDGHKAFVSIMEGCSKYCSFCVVPYTRGEEVSRPFDDVIAEVAHVARQGVREVTLLGQNVNGYYGEHHDGHICGFAELLRAVAAIPGIGRIRYTTSHPLEFNDALIQAHAEVPELAAHVHLPVQSGSNAILAAMKRNHEIATYKDIITRLKAAKPGIEIASDFIIGFPNETEQDFQDTLDLIEFVNYDHSYSFIYSKRPGTPAAELPDSVSHVEKKQRLQRVQTLIARNTGHKTDAMMGTEQRVLIDRESKRYPGYLVGIAENTRWIHFPGDASLIGRFATLKISGIESINALRAEAPLWVESPEAASVGIMPIPGRIPLWHAAL